MDQDRLVELLDSFYDPGTKKELTLLKILERHGGWISLHELQTISGFSRPTLIKHLTHSIEDSRDNASFCLRADKKRGYYLEVHNSFDCGQYYRNRLYSMWPIQFVKELVLKKAVNKNFFVQDFFISDSSLKQKIRQIRMLLRGFDVELVIDTGKYYVVGDEANIRRLSEEFFWEFFKGSVWPFDSVNEEQIIEKTKIILTNDYNALSMIEQRKLHYQLAIQEIRCSNGFFFQMVPTLARLTPILDRSIKDPAYQSSFFPSLNEMYYFYFLLAAKIEYYPCLKFDFLPDAKKDDQLAKLSQLNIKIIEYISQSIEAINAEQTQFLCDFLFSTHVNLKMYGNVHSLNSTTVGQRRSAILDRHIEKITDIICSQFSLTAEVEAFLSSRYKLVLLQLFPPKLFEPIIRIGFCTELNFALERKMIQLLELYFSDLYNVQFSSGVAEPSESLDIMVHTSLAPEVFLAKNVKQTVYIDIRNLYHPGLSKLIDLIAGCIVEIQQANS